MKHLLSLTVIIAIFFTSCDYINIPLEKPVPIPIDTTSVDTTNVSTRVDANGYPLIDTAAINLLTQKVFVEEFTGHSCSGCPTQTDKLLTLQQDQDPEVIIATYHEGTFAVVDEPLYPTDMTTAFGGELHSYIKQDIDAYPSAMVNRKTFSEFGNKYVFQAHAQWASPILASVNALNPTIAMGVGALLNSDGTFLKIRVSMQAQTAISDEHRLLVLCIEDSVIAEQKDQRLDDSEYPHKIDTEYVHKHTVRSAVNSSSGIYGETIIPSSGISALEWVNWETNYPIPMEVTHAEHVIIIAAIFNVTTSEVVQVEEVHAIQIK